MTDTEVVYMRFIQPLVVGLRPDPVTGGLTVCLHGGSHAHMAPGEAATNLARQFALHGPVSVCPPAACSNSDCE